MKRTQTIHAAENIGKDRWQRPTDDFVHEDLVSELARFRRGLAAAAQNVAFVGDNLKAPAVAWDRVAERREVNGQALQASFEEKRPRHHQDRS